MRVVPVVQFNRPMRVSQGDINQHCITGHVGRFDSDVEIGKAR